MRAWWLFGLAIGCGHVMSPDDDPVAATCDPLARFDTPRPLTNLDPAQRPADASLSADELTLFLTQNAPAGDRDVYATTRASIDDDFAPPVPLAALNSPADDLAPSISSDGLALLFHSKRVPTEGSRLYVATRESRLAGFAGPAPIANVGATDPTRSDLQPVFAADGQTLWFASDRGGDLLDLYQAPRVGDGFGAAVEVSELDSPATDQHPAVSADGLTIYFASDRPFFGARGNFDVFRAQRASATEPFSPPVLVDELNTSLNDNPRWLSADQCRMYLHSDVGGNFTVYVATRVVD